MNNRVGNIFLYFIIGLVAVHYGLPLLMKGIGLAMRLIGGAIALTFGTIGLVFAAVPLIIIGWLIYTLVFKSNSTNSN